MSRVPLRPSPLPFPFPLSAEEIAEKRRLILSHLTAADDGFSAVPVRSIKQATLDAMLRETDRSFLSGFLSGAYPGLPVTLSSRMTSAAGKFVYRKKQFRRADAEIRMSSDFLFRLNRGPFSLNGLTVQSPQLAFLVVFEHEVVHAVEYALYGRTDHASRFRSLAYGLFGHTDIRHSLPTRAQEQAERGIAVGSRVRFTAQGRALSGIVTYIGKTATVMVPSPGGGYLDRAGNRYVKYRVPLSLLRS